MSDEHPEKYPEEHEEGLTQAEEKKLTSDQFDDFAEALEILYIPANLGGRLNFLKKWPQAAAYVFGEELIICDTDGIDDRTKREELEQAAAQRRAELVMVVKEFQDKSVDKGVLQKDYVDSLIRELGRDLALLFYATRFVDAIFAPSPEVPSPSAPQAPVAGSETFSEGAPSVPQDPSPLSQAQEE